MSPDHRFIHYAFRGRDYRLFAERARELLHLHPSETQLHQLCYGNTEPPRRPHDGEAPSTELVHPCFTEPFGEGSSRLPCDLTPVARVLNEIMRRTLLPRVGFREGLTRIQLWLLAYLVGQREFDVWDVIVSEMEDTIAEGFKGRRQLPFAHWVCHHLSRSGNRLSEYSMTMMSRTATIFPHYDMRQLTGQGSSRGSGRGSGRRTRQSGPVHQTEQQ